MSIGWGQESACGRKAWPFKCLSIYTCGYGSSSSSRKKPREYLHTLWDNKKTNNRNNTPSTKTITAGNKIKNFKHTRIAALPSNIASLVIRYFWLTVDGNWTQWSHWSTCSLSCGGGRRSRNRSCTDPPPSNNGKPCAGEGSEHQPCNTQSCPGRSIRVMFKKIENIYRVSIEF